MWLRSVTKFRLPNIFTPKQNFTCPASVPFVESKLECILPEGRFERCPKGLSVVCSVSSKRT